MDDKNNYKELSYKETIMKILLFSVALLFLSQGKL